MQCNGKHISWSHLITLYNRDTAAGEGIRILPKLKFEHISLNSFSKMRVDLAAQVGLSSKYQQTFPITLFSLMYRFSVSQLVKPFGSLVVMTDETIETAHFVYRNDGQVF